MLFDVSLFVFIFHLCGVSRCKASSASDPKVAIQDMSPDSPIADIVYLGEKQEVILFRTENGHVYRSPDSGLSWQKITDGLGQKSITRTTGVNEMPADSDRIKLIEPHPSDNKVVLLVGVKHVHYLSEDSGKSWRFIKHHGLHTYLFHPTDPKSALVSSWSKSCDLHTHERDPNNACQHALYRTSDGGKTFSIVASYVVQFSWGSTKFGSANRIYFTHHKKKSGDQPHLHGWFSDIDFACTDDNGQSVNTLIPGGNKFVMTKDYLFVAEAEEVSGNTVRLEVSANGAKSFATARIPVALEQHSYTILDAAHGFVMLHVHHGWKNGREVGNIYASDATGTLFSLSLPNVASNEDGEVAIERIVSMDGVYIANYVDDPLVAFSEEEGELVGDEPVVGHSGAAAIWRTPFQEGIEFQGHHGSVKPSRDEDYIRTVISFDNGGMWTYLDPPQDDHEGRPIECPKAKCSVHLHVVSSEVVSMPIYATEAAVGIILAMGNIGPYLRYEQDEINTYLSRDGGLTWQEVHAGSYSYEIGDHGALIVMADATRKTNSVVFSWTEGSDWYDFDLGAEPFHVTNILTSDSAASTKFVVYGTRDYQGVLYHLDFSTILPRICSGYWAPDGPSTDYETWIPSAGIVSSDSCLLGRITSYVRRKPHAKCFNGETFERPVFKNNCPCTFEDYHCALGFARTLGETECKPVDVDAVLTPEEMECTSSSAYFADAYRRVPGDTCEGGFVPAQAQVPCPSSSPLSKAAWVAVGLVVFFIIVLIGLNHASSGPGSNGGFETLRYVKYATLARAGEEAVGYMSDNEDDE
ncbi:sortilin, putative [Perkinsus marinus ATCC 50983]|uniref:Sortilin, putative n=1 Tax=Perkinsus marinus (strain ATCC 50983 / TXsc) TaxID=423536 RepID=C5LTY6_PERM5|nr:sortilin, putative [Perkinsus marinus ATCC 50983]EEQ99784.1 sortilin, putative [Perkinsus marinus ATCC 50983]|eukprot:XP_002767067.1 sortilin, putative [Perkinsus marinus ATCC 50983]